MGGSGSVNALIQEFDHFSHFLGKALIIFGRNMIDVLLYLARRSISWIPLKILMHYFRFPFFLMHGVKYG